MENIKGKRQKLIPKSILFLTLFCALLLGVPLLSPAAQAVTAITVRLKNLSGVGHKLSCSATACSSPTGRWIRYTHKNCLPATRRAGRPYAARSGWRLIMISRPLPSGLATAKI